MADGQPTRPVLPDEDAKAVTLREFEQRISELKEMMQRLIASEREMRETITDHLESARELNAVEIKRRLDELNHAHATAMENWAHSLPRELFDAWQKEFEKWRSDVGTQLTLITPHASMIDGVARRLGALENDVNSLKTVGSPHVQAVDLRVDALEKLVSKFTGAGILLGLMGVTGVVSFALSLLRLAGVVR